MSDKGSEPGIRQETGTQFIPRLGNGRFAPGVSPNPTGRPKGTRHFAHTIQAHTNHGEELVRFMLRVFRGKVSGVKVRLEDRMAAATWLADRGFGKPSQFQQPMGDGDAIQLEAMKRAAELFRSRVLSLVAHYDSPARASESSAAGVESACSSGLPQLPNGD